MSKIKTENKSKRIVSCAIVAATCGLASMMAPSPAGAQQVALMHEPDWYGQYGPASGHGHGGCFVTTTPTHHTRGIRHWRYPCPYHHRGHLNPYHPPHHRLYPHH
ncbi:hypothetical protein [Methylocystis suflitae]|uniref:hypothetical protein n=1 Tax=Methylocystis suflitae TaxID=2951405 RepID=UPI00210BAAC2|nr:hypothetical protein [Methylocystis suflitae]MCQ4190338.1 hypothetical protein [Methylocystis suflitae]